MVLATKNLVNNSGFCFEFEHLVNRFDGFLERCQINFADFNAACSNVFKRLFTELDGQGRGITTIFDGQITNDFLVFR